MKNPLIKLTIIFSLILSLISCISLREHQQMQTFADILTTSNRINQEAVPGSNNRSPNTSTPKIAAGIIIPIICVGLFLIFCFFCLKCAQNEQEQAEQGLEESIPCYCGPVKLMFKCCRYILCIDIILRCLGFRKTNYEKEEQKRMKEEEQRRKKEDKERLKWQKKHGTSRQDQSNGTNPYYLPQSGKQVPKKKWFWQ